VFDIQIALFGLCLHPIKTGVLLLLLKLYLHTVFSSGFNMQQTKLDKLQK
jgi:hypothetical protein